ncbi:MAG TPA: hypothetical protein VL117_04895 [Thermoleophilia bacterium]|nr:hypothetical protein [Thermoleophilia bacterium]
MKRLSLCLFVACVACLLLAPVALATTRSHSPARVRHATSVPRSYARLGADPTYAISGVVRDFNGDLVQGAEVEWGSPSSGGDNNPNGTGADGAFMFPAVTSNPGFDDLTIYYPQAIYAQAADAGLWKMESWALDFSTQSNYEMQPAHVSLHVVNAPAPAIEVVAGDGLVGYAQTDVRLDGSSDGVASVLPMNDFDDVVAYYYTDLLNFYTACHSQVEALSTSPVSLTAGNTAPGTVSLDWHDAQQAYLYGPLCRHSGKPGTKISMVVRGWPAGETATFVGYAGSGTGVARGAVTTSVADQTLTTPITIPTSAPVGIYEVDTYRTGSMGTPGAASLVGMWDLYQVCTFKPSASSIQHGHAVRLSGRVPSNTSVTVYATTHKVSAAPGTFAAKGWHRIGAYKTKLGRFSTGLLHPTRTTWYVVKYKGWAFQAFTSITKVRVR